MSELIAQLHSRHGLPLLTADNYDNFVYGNADVVLCFAGDPATFPESADLVVILPELLKAFRGLLQGALVDRSIERELQARYRFTGWPTLVFLRKGEYLGAITGLRDWPEYGREIALILAAEPSQPPGFDLDKVCGGHA
ncbi:hydrogenase [Methylomonas koyamae]|uniref:hydrogenase n=1 Tax=Methylomonas koyamae TaxID=702114 RepID=UPI0011269EEE|nr:hydrogenase [Methylomonas koyamae]TPQ28238.1 hydrogenase [Methylomonas koyamae]